MKIHETSKLITRDIKDISVCILINEILYITKELLTFHNI